MPCALSLSCSHRLSINSCSASTLHVVVAQNTDADVLATVTAGTVTGCTVPWTPTFATPWRLTAAGTGAVSGSSTQWSAALRTVTFNLLGATYTGNLTSGVTAFQPTAGTSPVCFRFAGAGSFSGPLTGDGRLDTTYCFEGAAAGWSLTN